MKAPKEIDRELYDACNNGKHADVVALLAQGASLDFVEPRYQYTPLLAAAEAGHTSCVRAVLDAEGRSKETTVAIANTCDQFGQTSLMLASYNGHCEVVEALLAAGCNPGLTNKDKAKAEDFAVDEGYDNIVELLRAGTETFRIAAEALEALEALKAAQRAAEAPPAPEALDSTAPEPTEPKGIASGSSDAAAPPASQHQQLGVPPGVATALGELASGAQLGVAAVAAPADTSLLRGLSVTRCVELDTLATELAALLAKVDQLGTDEERQYVLARVMAKGTNKGQ
jgi:hypothetical protein